MKQCIAKSADSHAVDEKCWAHLGPHHASRISFFKVQHTLVRYFRINESETGQFERTLIVVEEGAHVSYLEGCTAPPSPATRAIWAYCSK